MIPLLHANQSEGCPDNGEAVQGGVSGPLQLWQGLHWGDVWRLKTRMKEHQDACQKGALEKLAFAEHVWESHSPIRGEETTVVDQVRTYKELLLKEVIHIWLLITPSIGMGYWSCLDVGWLP